MSSTETLPIDRPAPTIRVTVETYRLILAMAVLALIWITLRPFDAGGLSEGGESSFTRSGVLINQVGYTIMAAIALATVVMCVDRRVLVQLLSPAWLLMLAIVALSAVTGDEAGVWRSVAYALLAVLLAATVPILTATTRDFEVMLKTVSLVLLGACYAGLVLNPSAAIHQGFELESFHAGLWRGSFTHKNIAGIVMVMVGFGGIFLMRRGHWLGGTVIAILAFLFAFKAGSKTALALVPVVFALVLMPALIGFRVLAALMAATAIVGAYALTVGTVFVPAFDSVLRLFSETDFTGRIAIWDFAGDYVIARPWTGFGFDSFWSTPLLLSTEQPFDRPWDPRGIVHGHNGLIDVALFFGLPGVVVLSWLMVVAPALDYIRAARSGRAGPLADFFFMVIVFAALSSALESFYFRRADPIWLTMVIAMIGLRLTARMPLRQ